MNNNYNVVCSNCSAALFELVQVGNGPQYTLVSHNYTVGGIGTGSLFATCGVCSTDTPFTTPSGRFPI